MEIIFMDDETKKRLTEISSDEVPINEIAKMIIADAKENNGVALEEKILKNLKGIE